MDADSDSTQERKPGSFSVSELRAKLNGKLQGSKDDPEQDESNKSSIRSLDSSFEMPKEELSPVMKKISQFQTQTPPVPSPSVKSPMAHSSSGSTQPAQNASNPNSKILSSRDSNGTSETQNKAPSADSSNRPSVSSPSVAALRSQLALSPAMLRPGDSGPARVSRSLKGNSADLTPLNACTDALPTTSKPETEKAASGSSTVTPKAPSRVSDIQQRLALDPTMFLPSPVSGLPSRNHRRGKSTASPAAANPAPDVFHDSQMNRPRIASRSRRSRTSSKFTCDDEVVQTLDEIEKLSMQLDSANNVLIPQEQIAQTDQNLIVPENLTAELKIDCVERPAIEATDAALKISDSGSLVDSQVAPTPQLKKDSDGHQNIIAERSLSFEAEQIVAEETQPVDATDVAQHEQEKPVLSLNFSDQNPVSENKDEESDSTVRNQCPVDSAENAGNSCQIERPMRSSRHRTMDSDLQVLENVTHPVVDSNSLQQDSITE